MECYASKWKAVGLLFLACLMVAMSGLCAAAPALLPKIFGWFGVAFFGLAFIAIPMMSFRTGPQVIFNDEGIEDRRLKVGVIRWVDIHDLSITSVHSTKFLSIHVLDPERYLSRMPWWKRELASANLALGFSALTISFAGLSPGIEEVREYLEGWGARRYQATMRTDSDSA